MATMSKTARNPHQPVPEQRRSPRKTQEVRTTSEKQTKKKVSPQKKAAQKVFLKRIAKINTLPKNVRESIPLSGFMENGIIETEPGTFTKSYRLQDVNFAIVPEEDQMMIIKNYMDFMNMFGSNVKWQINIFNHEVDKRTTLQNIRIPSQKDGLNKHRQEMNNVLLQALKRGNNSVDREKYLTVAVDDTHADHAAITLNNLDAKISERLRKITKSDTKPLSTQERMKVLYDIYNQDSDYRIITGLYDEKNQEIFDLSFIERVGLSVKDVIGPSSMDFSKSNMFMIGDTYAQALYLATLPTTLSTSFLADLSEIPSNMLISISAEAVNMDLGVKLVKNQLASIEARATAVTKRNNMDGYYGQLPPDLERAMEDARELLRDMQTRNQNLYLLTFLVVVFARTQEQLDENVKMVQNIGGKHLVGLKTMKFQQEFCFNSALPLCRNDTFVDLMYTTESAAVFIPYNTQEINQKNAIFYGLNQTSKSMILYDRLTGNNYNGLFFGYAGSGKSFTAKLEMISVLLNHMDAQVFVIDPQGEYYPLTRSFNGEEIRLSPGNRVYLNPLDLDISEDEEDDTDPITAKSDFIISMFDIIVGRGRKLEPVHTSLIDKCTRKIYGPYIEQLRSKGETFDPTICPTLSDLYQELMMIKQQENNYAAAQLVEVLYQYSVGSFDTFAHRTNVHPNARFVVYNTKSLGTGMKELALHICTNDVWNRMIANSKKHIYTWFYIDEFHVLLESDSTTLFLKRIWKMARKWLGVPTGIMQNTEDLLRNPDTRAIVNNTSFVIMLQEKEMDQQNLGELYHLSQAQLDYITNSEPGHGLLFNGKVVVPFASEFPKNTNLYRILTTQHDVEGAKFC